MMKKLSNGTMRMQKVAKKLLSQRLLLKLVRVLLHSKLYSESKLVSLSITMLWYTVNIFKLAICNNCLLYTSDAADE